MIIWTLYKLIIVSTAVTQYTTIITFASNNLLLGDFLNALYLSFLIQDSDTYN